MAVLTVTINNPTTSFVGKASEVTWLIGALMTAATELRSAAGNKTSGTIVGMKPEGQAGSLGTWTYTPTASFP